MSNVIPLRPKHQPLKYSHATLLTVLKMIREGGHSKQTIDLLLSAVADNLYDYMETLEGR